MITYDAAKRSTYRYQDEATAQEALLDAVQNGLIKYTSADSFTATDRGRAFLSELYAQHAQVLESGGRATHMPPAWSVSGA